MLKNSKVKKLKKLKRDYSNERKGYRDRQYDILADTMAIVVEMSQSSWLVAGVVPGLDHRPLK